MKPVIEVGGAVVYHGNNLEVLPFLADNSVDSIVCDPPYELGFMGKKWDSTGIAYSVELWEQCLRVLKPGGHLLAFGGSRTWHRLAVAIEDAGFELRDSIAWIYGSGFPKSHNVALGIDKHFGHDNRGRAIPVASTFQASDVEEKNKLTSNPVADYTARSPEAEKWQGWGTALKPAFEPVVVARKPLIGTVAQNVLEWGVGGLNIDASRIGLADNDPLQEGVKHLPKSLDTGNTDTKWGFKAVDREAGLGRWPANVMFGHAEDCSQIGSRTEKISNHNAPSGTFAGGEPDRGSDTSEYRNFEVTVPVWSCVDGCPVKLLDQQSGVSKSTGVINRFKSGAKPFGGAVGEEYESVQGVADSGGASRFFYVAKANKRDRNEGLEELPEVRHADRNKTDGVGGNNPRNRTNQAKQNFHPTVKPTDLMRYLIKLVTPPEGVVLDPFTGSGSTGKAALLDGYRFIGIELTEEYLPIIEGRLTWAESQKQNDTKLF